MKKEMASAPRRRPDGFVSVLNPSVTTAAISTTLRTNAANNSSHLRFSGDWMNGIDFEEITINILKGEQHTPEYKVTEFQSLCWRVVAEGG
ncbi:hypothetical protein Hdeb2414_s0006g00216431 [Helianthus debilis subsp. tardiflorus]